MALTEINSLGIKDAEVKTADLAADAVTGAKIADDAIDSEHYTDGSIDAAHLASNAVTTAKINADAVTGAKIADDAIDSEHYTDGSIDTAHIAADAVTGAKIADDAVGAEHIEQLDNNLQFADSCHAKFGTDNDLAVYHDGTNANIINTTGNLYIEDSSGDVIIRAKGSENSIYCHDDGSVDLYYDNEAKIVTKANGATVQDLTASGAYLDIKGSDGVNGKVYGVSGTTIGLLDDQNHYLIKGVKDGATSLYYDNSVKLATSSAGGTLTGTWSGVGKILQVVTAEHSATTSTTGTAYVDTGLTANITPASSSNKIMVIVSQSWYLDRGTDQARGGIRLVRESTVIEEGPNQGDGSAGGGFGVSTANGPSAIQTAGRYNLTMVDSPSTTSEITYHTEMANHQTGSSPTLTINKSLGNNGQNGKGYITLLEIAG